MASSALTLSTVLTLGVATFLVPPDSSAAAAAPPRRPASPARTAASASPQSGAAVALGPSTGTVALLAAAPTVAKGTGPVRNATTIDFTLGDRVKVSINVGSGNLLVRRSDLSLPGVTGNVTLGAAYNSLLIGSDLPGGAAGTAWRTRTGVDVRLIKADDASVTYVAEDGVVGRFVASGSGYTTPKEFKASLAVDGTGWRLTENETGRRLYFTSAGNLDRWIDRNNNTTDVVYDSSNRMTKIMSTRGTAKNRTAVVGYDSSGRISEYRQDGSDGTSRTVSYGYDAAGNLATVTDAIGGVTRWEYDSSRNLTAIVEPNGNRTTVTYDGQHRVTSLTRVTDTATGKGATTRLAYTSATETRVADANTDLSTPVTSVPNTTYTVDADEHVTKVVDAAGNTRSTSYTPFYDVATATNGEGGTTTNTYGANSGQSLTRSASATGAAVSVAYANANTSSNPTAAWQPSSGSDTQGNASLFVYNGTGNRTSAKDAAAAESKVDYNTDGTVKSATDPGNGTNATTYAYTGDTDGDGVTDKQLTTITPPTGNSLRARKFTYDAYGRIKTSDDGAGRITTYTYDGNDRISKISYSDGTRAVDYTYDGSGNVRTRVDATATTTYGYDKLNRLVSRNATSGGGTLTYQYDPVGNLTKLTDARGTSSYEYDARNLQTRLTTAGGLRYDFGYDKDGRRVTTWFNPNADRTTWAMRSTTTFDKSGRIRRITAARASDPSKIVYDVSLCYSKYTSGQPCNTATSADTGLRQWRTDNATGTLTQYTYDKSNRLTAATNVNGCNYSIGYDARGNRLRYADGASSGNYPFTYNSGNQVTASSESPGAKFAYDAAGNATVLGEREVTLFPSGTKEIRGTYLQYNAAGQTTGMRDKSTAAWTRYQYLGPDQTEMVNEGNGWRQYVYGRPNQYGLPQLQSFTDGYSGTYQIESDATGGPIGFRHSGTDYAYVLDDLGSPIALVDQSGTLRTTYGYGLDGQENTAAPYDDVADGNPIGYAGGVFVPDTSSGTLAAGKPPAKMATTSCGHSTTVGMTKFGQRFMPTPRLTAGGGFTQQDSLNVIGDPSKGNRYAYAACNPVNYIDPTGRVSCAEAWFLAGVAVAALGISTYFLLGLATATAVSTLASGLTAGGFLLSVVATPEAILSAIESC